ncbi:Methyl-accepting chemotaxis protein [Devosia sp. LC5]|uniref:methyl-accepting chemotaxis protein n=1 Tax=Devosia sp. LC5 TaxID=1502724 RepID=UPI0004E3E9FA|nr:methyl-accepting chemotaxis protein [Devosia sp. LC5]KFC71820.1 Methyl-accepting chemotaxis protein [Devosia sp. LC5]
MHTLRLALIAGGLWLAAFAAALGLLPFLGWSLAWFGASVVAAGLAFAGTVLAVAMAAQREQAMLGAIALAAGLTERPRGPLAITDIVEKMNRRLEAAHHFKSGIAALQQCALVADDAGGIVVASAGLRALAPEAVPGGTLDGLFGSGYLKSGGGAPEQGMVALGTKRFEVMRRPVAAGRFLLELIPAGCYIEDDDLDAYAAAMAAGQTGFRFEADAAARNRALASLNRGIEAVDEGLEQIDRVLAGDSGPMGVGALGRQARELADFLAAMEAQLADAVEARAMLEGKLGAVARLIGAFENRAARFAGFASGAADDLDTGGQALQRGGELVRRARATERDARALAGEAELAAGRTHAAVGDIDQMTAEIAKMIGAIEDVSFRINLLALNAAVEAARAGEKGAGFAVVADEVRMLAQLTNKSAMEIRSVVSRGRGQAETGLAHAQSLQKVIAALGGHLRNLSNETDTITATLDDGETAIKRLAGRMEAFDAVREQDAIPSQRLIA